MNPGFPRGLSPPAPALGPTQPPRSGSNKLQSLLHGQPLAEVFFHLRFVVGFIISACCCRGFPGSPGAGMPGGLGHPRLAWGGFAALPVAKPRGDGAGRGRTGPCHAWLELGTARGYPVDESVGGRQEPVGGDAFPGAPQIHRGLADSPWDRIRPCLRPPGFGDISAAAFGHVNFAAGSGSPAAGLSPGAAPGDPPCPGQPPAHKEPAFSASFPQCSVIWPSAAELRVDSSGPRAASFPVSVKQTLGVSAGNLGNQLADN